MTLAAAEDAVPHKSVCISREDSQLSRPKSKSFFHVLQRRSRSLGPFCFQASRPYARPGHTSWCSFFFDIFSGSRATNAGSIECRARARELIRKAPKEKENRGIMWCYACIHVPAAACFDRLRRCQKAFGHLFRSSRSLACTEWLMLIGRDDDER